MSEEQVSDSSQVKEQWGESARGTLRQRLTWLMLARVILSVGIGLSFVFLQATSLSPLYSESNTPIIISVFVAIYLSNLVFIWSLSRIKRRFVELAFLQLATDCAGSGSLIFLTGGLESPLIFLFALHVIVGATLLSREGAWFVVVLASGIFSLISISEVSQIEFDRGTGMQTLRYIITSALFQIGTLCFIASLTGYLSEQTKIAQLRLSFASADMKSLRRLNDHLLMSVHNGIIFCDPNGLMMIINQAAQRLLGGNSETLLRRPIQDLFPQLPEELSQQNLTVQLGDQSMLDGWGVYRWEQHYTPLNPLENEHVEMAVNRSSGHSFRRYDSSITLSLQLVLHCTLSRVSDELDPTQTNGWALIIQDVTQRRHLEAKIERRERLASLGEVASQIAHEVRNPLAGMVSSIELLRKRNHENDHGSDAALNMRLLGIIEREAQRINQLTDNFLSFARPPRPALRECILHLLIDELQLIEQRPIISTVEEHLIVYADPDQVRQIFLNLFRNAWEAGSEVIELEAYRQSVTGGLDEVIVVISDRGEGFDDGLTSLELLFQPFFTQKSTGTGLGLSLCRSLAESQGGQLEARRREGGGASFILSLPAVQGENLSPVTLS